jgi:hypothetical protein
MLSSILGLSLGIALDALALFKAPFISTYARWIAPTLTITSEQYALSLMLGRPLGHYQNLGWIEPSLHKIRSCRRAKEEWRHDLDGHPNHFPELERWRIGLGAGYRHLIYSHWIVGCYVYYDANIAFKDDRFRYEEEYVPRPWWSSLHTLNLGIENKFPGWECTNNIYWNIACHPDFESSSLFLDSNLTHTNLSPGLHMDTKVTFDVASFKCSIGGYYKQQSILHKPHLSSLAWVGYKTACEDSKQSGHTNIDEGGPVVEIRYSYRRRQTYSIKYVWNMLHDQYRIIFSAQFHLFATPQQGSPSFAWHQQRWQPVERYFGPVSKNDEKAEWLSLNIQRACSKEEEKVMVKIFEPNSPLGQVTQAFMRANPINTHAKELGVTLTTLLLPEHDPSSIFHRAYVASTQPAANQSYAYERDSLLLLSNLPFNEKQTEDRENIRSLTTSLRQLPPEVRCLVFRNFFSPLIPTGII